MSRIREKVSKIFTSQIPEFIRAGELDATNVQTISTTASSKQVTVNDTRDIIAGDRLQHPAITSTVFVTKVLSTTKIEVSAAITVTLSNQSAKFIRADSTSTFVKFLEAYYKFLEQDQYPQEVLQNARKYGDAEFTTNDLIDKFFLNYGSDIPRNIITDKRSFIRHFGDIYKTKGTEEAYKLLFRAMFNSKAEFFYPSEVVLKPSDGVWKKDYTIKVYSITGYDPFDLINTKIVGEDSGASAYVNNVLKLANGYREIYELSLETIKGNFTTEVVSATKRTDISTTITVKANTNPQLSKIDIIDGTAGYEEGTLVRVYGGALGRITATSDAGKIKGIKIIEPGLFGVTSSAVIGGPAAPIFVPAPTKSLTGNVVFLSNVGVYTSNVSHGLLQGITANISFPYFTAIQENTISVKSVLDSKRFTFNYTFPNIASNVSTEVVSSLRYTQVANLFANVGILRESDGYWVNSKGKLSELVYVQGAALNAPDPSKLFYQPYSYVVKSDVSIGEWNSTASQLIHPAGTEVFGEIDINKDVSANLETTGPSEIWDYLGFTCDSNTAPFNASITTYTNSRVTNLALTTDMVFTLFGYL
jgi:hypothetical protein